MGLFSKIKNILFEEEEIEVPVKEPKKEQKVKEEVEVEPEIKLEKAKQVVDESEDVTLFEKEPTFNFPDFDEDEFENTLPKYKEEPKKEEPKLYFEHQRELKKEEPKKEELRHKSDIRSIGRGYAPLDKPVRDNAPKKFVPSPIISPVYGILDKDYHPDDILAREDADLKRNRLDVDSVRKKAFEPKVIKADKEEPIKEIEEVKEEKVEEPVREELPKEEKKPKKTVDELLADSAEEVVAVDEELNVENNIKEIEDELDKIDDELVLDEKPKEKDDDDTLEQDLFELIDSMYEDDKEDD